ncbi:MAG: hypothetical protein IPI06_02520 [Gammaproteobacteria bacterium]|nr:hypothetical protein [Gammaproteobacteria bacterium]
MENASPPAAPAPAPSEDKTIAILAYITVIGFIAAIIMHGNNKTALGAFHLRQTLGFFIMSLGMIILGMIPILGWIAMPFFAIFMLVCWVIGLIGAINGQLKPMPLVGPMFQKWFGTTFD